ncbi:MAG TPA: MBL fold metallo-hydrolase [Vicinamibacterales bacterium]|nr:MBL fold metallo-hydrolase [Vicinamibacterales bacterium]
MVSRRDFLAGSTLALVAGAVGTAERLRAWQQQPAPINPVYTPLRRNVGFFTGRGGAIGYLVDAKGVVVVDTQFPDSAKLFLAGLNERSKNRPVDRLINTHHHGDHTGGNLVFRGTAKRVVAHAQAAAHMRTPPGAQPPAAGAAAPEQLFPDATFTDVWREEVGDEWVRAKFYGRAHTSGDAVITFERANVAHMGDLMFNSRQPVVDRAAGATLRGWITVLERAAGDHTNDTIYIFGHAGANAPLTGSRAELMRLRDFFGALLGFVESQIKAGKSREEILAMRDPLKGFENFGAFGQSNAREPLTCAYEELTNK